MVPAQSGPEHPMTEALEQRLREALVEEYAENYPEASVPEANLADADNTLRFVFRALDRAGLVLAERKGGES